MNVKAFSEENYGHDGEEVPSFLFFPFLFAPIWEFAPLLEHRADFSVS
jgi:hypothetical protein